MSRSKEMDLTTGNPFQSLLKFAIPVILGNLFQLFYTLADSVIVGKTLVHSPGNKRLCPWMQRENGAVSPCASANGF